MARAKLFSPVTDVPAGIRQAHRATEHIANAGRTGKRTCFVGEILFAVRVALTGSRCQAQAAVSVSARRLSRGKTARQYRLRQAVQAANLCANQAMLRGGEAIEGDDMASGPASG